MKNVVKYSLFHHLINSHIFLWRHHFNKHWESACCFLHINSCWPSSHQILQFVGNKITDTGHCREIVQMGFQLKNQTKASNNSNSWCPTHLTKWKPQNSKSVINLQMLQYCIIITFFISFSKKKNIISSQLVFTGGGGSIFMIF